MNKHFTNSKQSRIARIKSLATWAVAHKQFTTEEVATVLGMKKSNASKFLKEFDFIFDVFRAGRHISYSFKSEVLSDFDAEKIVNKALYKSGMTEKHLSQSPDKVELEKAKKQISKLQDEIKYLKSQLESFEHLKICLKNILS